jgi:hypothetical protein
MPVSRLLLPERGGGADTGAARSNGYNSLLTCMWNGHTEIAMAPL